MTANGDINGNEPPPPPALARAFDDVRLARRLRRNRSAWSSGKRLKDLSTSDRAGIRADAERVGQAFRLKLGKWQRVFLGE